MRAASVALDSLCETQPAIGQVCSATRLWSLREEWPARSAGHPPGRIGHESSGWRLGAYTTRAVGPPGRLAASRLIVPRTGEEA